MTTDDPRNETAPPRRGRGRPRKADALSGAERARLFRERKKQREAARAAEGIPHDASAEASLHAEVIRLRGDLDRLRQDNADLASALELFLAARESGRRIPADVYRNIYDSVTRVLAGRSR